MLLEEKNAVIYGGGGAIGGAVARAFAREGAKVFLAGRALEPLEAVEGEIRSAGGVAETALVDALDEQSIERHLGEVVNKAGSIDISFNAISILSVKEVRMTAEDNKVIFRRLVEEVINPGRLDLMDEFVDPHFVDHYPPVPGRASGIEGFKHGFASLRSAFPDLRLTIEDMISEGEKVSFCITLHGTHLGAFAGIPPIGRTVTWPAVGIMLILEGKIKERWLQSDSTHLMEQLGADPSSGIADRRFGGVEMKFVVLGAMGAHLA